MVDGECKLHSLYLSQITRVLDQAKLEYVHTISSTTSEYSFFHHFYILQSKSTLPPFFCSRHFYRIELITYTINVPNYTHARGTEFNKMILYEVGVKGFFP